MTGKCLKCWHTPVFVSACPTWLRWYLGRPMLVALATSHKPFSVLSLLFEKWGCYYWPTSHKHARCIQIFKALRAVCTSHYQKHWNNWCEDYWFRCPQRTSNERDWKFPMESFYKSVLVLAQHTAQPSSSPEFDQSFTPKIKWWVIESNEADDTWQKVWVGGFLPPAYFAMETKAGLPSAGAWAVPVVTGTAAWWGAVITLLFYRLCW